MSMNEEINRRIELWRDPKTGAIIPFVDMKGVHGRLELSDRVITILAGETDAGAPCLAQLVYPRWPEPAHWIEQPFIPGDDDLLPLLDADGGLPNMELVPLRKDDGRYSFASSVLAGVIATLFVSSLCMWSWFLWLIWSYRGGGR